MSKDLETLVEERSLSDADLRKEGGESSRTTFTISPDAVEDLSWLANYYGVTQKRIVDHVLRILQSMRETEDLLIEAAQDVSLDDTVRKTVAIDPDTRSGLNEVSDELDVSRDRLVEVGIRLAKMFSEKNKARQREEVKMIREFREKGRDLEEKLTDPELQRGFGFVMLDLIDVVDAAENALESDTPIEIPL